MWYSEAKLLKQVDRVMDEGEYRCSALLNLLVIIVFFVSFELLQCNKFVELAMR